MFFEIPTDYTVAEKKQQANIANKIAMVISDQYAGYTRSHFVMFNSPFTYTTIVKPKIEPAPSNLKRGMFLASARGIAQALDAELMVNQRDIVEVSFGPDFGGNHPAIVLSNRLVQEVEGYFVCVMMTSKDHDDEFTFVITDDMLANPLNVDHCEARCQLISFVPLDVIIPNAHNNQMRIEPFRRLLQKINDSTFSTGDLN